MTSSIWILWILQLCKIIDLPRITMHCCRRLSCLSLFKWTMTMDMVDSVLACWPWLVAIVAGWWVLDRWIVDDSIIKQARRAHTALSSVTYSHHLIVCQSLPLLPLYCDVVTVSVYHCLCFSVTVIEFPARVESWNLKRRILSISLWCQNVFGLGNTKCLM